MTSKKVSILMAVLNGDSFIDDTINSVINQSFNNWELIVINNGSTDHTVKIVKEFMQKDDRIKLIDIPHPAKIEAYNQGFEKSEGTHIAFLGADDILPEKSLETRLASLNKDVDFSTCLLKTFSEDKKFDNVIFPKNRSLPNYSGGSIVFSRKIGEEIFPIPTKLPNEDTWSSLFLRAFCKNYHLSEPLYDYRIHKKNTYGYDISFVKKREGFFNRMSAYQLFYERYKNNKQNIFIQKYLFSYNRGLNYSKTQKTLPILFLPHLSIGEKLKFMMYSNEFLYKIRNRFFNFFSGLTNT